MSEKRSFLPFAVIMFLGLALTVFISLKGYVDSNRTEEVKSEGRVLYDRSCAGCHGKDLMGGPAGPALKPLNLTSEQIDVMIVNGIGTMAPGFLQGEDSKKVSDWLVEQNQGTSEPTK